MARFPQKLVARLLVLGALPGAVLLGATAALAQNPPASAAPPQGGAAQASKKAPAKEAAASPSAEAQLKKRVEQLEEQLIDLQVVIGTLESLAKAPQGGAASAPRAPAASGGGAADQARIEGIEMQIRALTQQMEQISGDMRRSGARPGDAASLPAPAGSLEPDAGTMAPKAAQPGAAVVPPGDDPIGGMLSEPLAPLPAPGPVAAAEPSQDPKTAYEAAYGYMLQQDYGAAQAGFGEFLKRHPGHALVPNALYWLGETFYVQKRYADAADAFDMVLAGHGSSNKAPDSQLKKAMTLTALGKKDDACSALRQLAVKFPNAPSHVKTKADSERRRAGCT